MAADNVVSLEELVAENVELRTEIERLRRKITELEARLDKSSRNSSMPPSSDRPGEREKQTMARAERRKRQAEDRQEKRATRRRGKQPGAPGSNLEMRDDPDEIVVREPQQCSSCGEDLTGSPAEAMERRQVFDVPDPRIICTEHRSVKKRCACGSVSHGGFAKEARAATCYGPNVRAMTLYLLHAQHLPAERCAKAISAMLGAEVSTGFVTSLSKEAAGGLGHFMELLRSVLLTEPVVHADETPDQVRTKTWWLHVVATSLYTHLVASRTRGKAAPDEAGVLPGLKGVMVHDRLAMYDSYTDAVHGYCGAHLLRDLESVARTEGQGWATAMALVLKKLNSAAHVAREAGATQIPGPKGAELLGRYDELVELARRATYADPDHVRSKPETDAYNLAVAFCRHKTEITRFAVDLRVPFTNNEAERALRMAKLHRKISGCFQAEDHARHFATIRSYIDTARKHGIGALDVLGCLFRGDPWMIPSVT